MHARYALRLVAAALAILAMLGPATLGPTSAQTYPTKSITLVVPLAAGTGMDTIARLYGEQLASSLGRPIVIDNRPGAAMMLAISLVARSAHSLRYPAGRRDQGLHQVRAGEWGSLVRTLGLAGSQ